MHGHPPTFNKQKTTSQQQQQQDPSPLLKRKNNVEEKKNNGIVITFQMTEEPRNPFQCSPCSNLFHTKSAFLKHFKSKDACRELLLADQISQAPTTTTTGADITTAWDSTLEGDSMADADLDVGDLVVQDRNETISTTEQQQQQQQHSLDSSVYYMGNANKSLSQDSAPDDPQESHHQQEATASSKTLQAKRDLMGKGKPVANNTTSKSGSP
ncbi:hypothetical protein BKA57DRAFT_509022 [Linnemannia elongata]|nr:hypothetical protein BKA57DRAFT_509022 [Linnemannia elongata]